MSKRGVKIGLSMVALMAAFGAASTARAASVMCSSRDGSSSCSVSNDGGFDNISCSCSDSGGDETTGGNDFEGLDEDALMEICLGEVAFCDVGGSTSVGTSVGTDPTESTTTVATDPTDSTTTVAETGPTDTGTGTTAATESGGTESGGTESGGTESGGSTEGGSTEGGSTGGSAEASASGAEASAGKDESSESGGGEDEDKSGCSCDAKNDDMGGLLGLGLLVALRLRRRRNG